MLNRAFSLLEIKQVDEDARIITGMATTPAADRLEDVVEPFHRGAISAPAGATRQAM